MVEGKLNGTPVPLQWIKAVFYLNTEKKDIHQKKTGKTVKIAVSTIQRCEKQLKEKGDLENKPLNRPFKKINPEKLKEYIKEHPDSYIKETAEVFNCSTTAIIKAFKRLGITRKKDNTL